MKKCFYTVLIFAFFCIYHGTPAYSSDLIYRGNESEVPIVMYHKLSKSGELLGKWTITPEEFEQDLMFFKENGFETVVMTDIINFVNNGDVLPPKPIILSFDDGDSSIYRYALPLLKKYNMKAVVSIIGEPTDKYSKESSEVTQYYPHLTWEQISELLESGHIEIQNHSYDMHHSKGVLKHEGESIEEYKSRFSKDINTLQERIYDITGIKSDTFVYPFGLKNDITDEVLKEMGFSASLSCYDKVNTIKFENPDCLFNLGRTLRPHGSSSGQIFKKFIN